MIIFNAGPLALFCTVANRCAIALVVRLAAASAYPHPLRDVQQTKHIVGPAAYATLALELHHPGDPAIVDREVAWAIDHAPAEVGEVLREMPARQAGKSRVDAILFALDASLRGRGVARDV